MIALIVTAALSQSAEVPTENLPMMMDILSADSPLVLIPRNETSQFAARALARFTKVPFSTRRVSAGASDYKLMSTVLSTRSNCGISLRDRYEGHWSVQLYGQCARQDLSAFAAAEADRPLDSRMFEIEMVRRRRASARGEMLLGAGVAVVGIALIAGSAASAHGQTHIDKGPWTGMVIGNTAGWLTAVGGGAIVFHGATRMASGQGMRR